MPGWMRVTAGLAAAMLAGCGPGPARSDQASSGAARLGCAPVAGIEALFGEDAPAWILIGESPESREGPAAAAEIACHLASRGDSVFFGYSDFAGGLTDAEKAMADRVRQLAGKGAAVTVAAVPPPVRTRNDRTGAERRRAGKIDARAAGAARRVLFTSLADAASTSYGGDEDRFAGYQPLALHLTGGVS